MVKILKKETTTKHDLKPLEWAQNTTNTHKISLPGTS